MYSLLFMENKEISGTTFQHYLYLTAMTWISKESFSDDVSEKNLDFMS